MLCSGSAKQAELATRTEQVTDLHAQRRREAIEEIRQAVRTVQAQTTVVPLARERAGSWQRRVDQLHEQETKGLGSFLATTEAKVEQFQAQRKLVEEMTNLQRASVKLRQSQGILPQECCPGALAIPGADGLSQPCTPTGHEDDLPPRIPAPADRPSRASSRSTDTEAPHGPAAAGGGPVQIDMPVLPPSSFVSSPRP